MTVQKGNVTASAWMDNKVVRVMSTASDATQMTSVQSRQRSGEKVPVSCPQSIDDYNRKMGGVDNGDQKRQYYRCPTKFRKFYMYIYSFLKDVCITNAYILHKQHSPNPKYKTVFKFRTRLAIELIGDCCSRKRPGCQSSTPVKTLPLAHFPLKHQEGKRGRCHLCKGNKKRTDTPWLCKTCQQWFCHSGKPDTDCFMLCHKTGI